MQDFSTALGSQRHFVTTGDSSPSAPTFPETPELPTQMFLIFIEDWISSLPGKDSLPTELSPPPVPQFLFLLCLVSNSISKETHLTSPAVHVVAAACCSTSSYVLLVPRRPFEFQHPNASEPESLPTQHWTSEGFCCSLHSRRTERGRASAEGSALSHAGGCLWPSR